MITCTICNGEFDQEDIRYYGDEPFCEDCFFDHYTYCSVCEEPVDRDYCRYDDSDNPICESCYEEDYDSDAPDNPIIYDNDRKEILSLSKDWLAGRRPKRLIKINHNDFRLEEIQEKVGLVDKGLYLYGLRDREEYQLMVSTNLFNRISQYTTLNNWKVTIEQDGGNNRIGISKSLRENKFEDIVELLQELTTIPKQIAA